MKQNSKMPRTNSSYARMATRDTHSEIYYTLQASSSTSAFKPQVPGFEAPRCKPPGSSSLLQDPKFQAAGLGAQAFNFRFRVQSSRFYSVPQILSPIFRLQARTPAKTAAACSTPQTPGPAPNKPGPHASGIQFHNPQVPAPDQRLKL